MLTYLKRGLNKLKYLELNNEVMQKKDGFFQLEKDREAVIDYKKEIAAKFKQFENVNARMHWLIDNNFYEDVYQYYTEAQVEELSNMLYAADFEFASYMAISKFYLDYAMKTDDKSQYLEHYEDRILIVSLYLAQGDFERAKEMAIAMIEQRYQPATPTFLNSGKARRGEMVSCFLLEADDSLNSINYIISTAMQLSKIGGGVGINLSKLRSRGESIKGVANAAKGVVPVMKLLEDAFNYADQMGQRKGAGAVYLNIFHKDVIEFLDTKKINADEKSRIQTLSLGLIVPDKFFELAGKGEDFYTFSPYSVYKKYNQHLDDMDIDQMYDTLVADSAVEKQAHSARQFLVKIAQTQFESGYPYIVYSSEANRANPLKDVGRIKMSNLCTEIFQVQTTSVINDYGVDDVIGHDISCNLGSLNIASVMERKNIKGSVHVGMDALTSVSDMSSIANAPGVRKANEDFHSVGLGAMNLHGYLAKNRIMYESEEARDFVRTFFMAVNYYSIEKSMMIARDRSKKFYGFDQSEYANGNYFEKYIKEDFAPKTAYVAGLFDGIEIPTIQMWEQLKNDVMKYGLYHAYRLAIAPTQSISYVQNATPSIMPVVDHIEVRTYGNATTYYPMPYLSKEIFFYYKSAYNMDMMNVIDIVAEIQAHVDQGISTILYVTSETNTRDLAKYYIYAQRKGLKSLYYTRTKNLTVDDCVACAV